MSTDPWAVFYGSAVPTWWSWCRQLQANDINVVTNNVQYAYDQARQLIPGWSNILDKPNGLKVYVATGAPCDVRLSVPLWTQNYGEYSPITVGHTSSPYISNEKCMVAYGHMYAWTTSARGFRPHAEVSPYSTVFRPDMDEYADATLMSLYGVYDGRSYTRQLRTLVPTLNKLRLGPFACLLHATVLNNMHRLERVVLSYNPKEGTLSGRMDDRDGETFYEFSRR
ncbi:MAG: hypothetical protein KDB07_05720, partial [Planctomycetes bacterium]|nr:hypothetical protein [Planctomycetota bacterium]